MVALPPRWISPLLVSGLAMLGLALGAPAQAAAPPKPQLGVVSAAYAGSSLYGTTSYCDRSVRSTVHFRVTWKAYRVKDGTLWKSRRSSFSTGAQCRRLNATFANAPIRENHYLVVTVTNLATGRSGTRRSATGITT